MQTLMQTNLACRVEYHIFTRIRNNYYYNKATYAFSAGAGDEPVAVSALAGVTGTMVEDVLLRAGRVDKQRSDRRNRPSRRDGDSGWGGTLTFTRLT